MAVGFALEGIIHVSALAPQERNQRGDEISRQKQRPPAFALADVDALVFSRGIEKLLVTAEDDVSEGHRAGSAAQQGAVTEKPTDQAAVHLEHALDYADLAAAEQRRPKKQQADQ